MPHDPDQDRRDWDREIVEDRARDARQTPFFAPPRDDCEQYFAADDPRCVGCPPQKARGCAEGAEIVVPEDYPDCRYIDICPTCPLACDRRVTIFERLPTPDLPEPLPFTEPPLPPEGRRPTAEEAAA